MSAHKCKVLFYLLACAACRPASSYEVQVEASATPEEVAQVKEAAGDWEENVPELRLDVRPAHGGCAGLYACITIDVTPEYLEAPCGVGATENAGDIVVSRLLSRVDTARMLRHELGHAFGLKHGESGTLMDASEKTWAYVVTPRDVTAWRALR